MLIPKVIHYIWVGPNELTPLAKKCIASWRKHLPDYEIKLWNEENSPMDHLFVREMYKKKKWAFVSDYIRFWVLEKEGGIYLDTDMEVLKNLDKFLKDQTFFAKTSDGSTACGIIGTIPHTKILKDILNFYNNDTEFSTVNTSPKIVSEILNKNLYKDVVVYSAEKFYPCNLNEQCTSAKLKKAYTNHHWAESWVSYRFLRRFMRTIGVYYFLRKIKRFFIVPMNVSYNISSHNKVIQKYESLHTEIYNDIEQKRLCNTLDLAVKNIHTNSKEKKALDFGAGAGNLTKHLLALGLTVHAADISRICLSFIKNKIVPDTDRLQTILINGNNLSNISDNTYDMVATYSVLHHIPNYHLAVQEMIRVLKPGGIIYIDHEKNHHFWDQNLNLLQEFYNKMRWLLFLAKWKNLLNMSVYVGKIRRIFNPRFQNEGDIHVFHDDHIEWDIIKSIFNKNGVEVMFENDYLLYDSKYSKEVYLKYADKISDTKVLIGRKK